MVQKNEQLKLENENAIKNKDHQLKKYSDQLSQKVFAVASIEDQIKKIANFKQKTVKLSTTREYAIIDYDKMVEDHEKEDHAVIQEFIIRFANFLFRK